MAPLLSMTRTFVRLLMGLPAAPAAHEPLLDRPQTVLGRCSARAGGRRRHRPTGRNQRAAQSAGRARSGGGRAPPTRLAGGRDRRRARVVRAHVASEFVGAAEAHAAVCVAAGGHSFAGVPAQVGPQVRRFLVLLPAARMVAHVHQALRGRPAHHLSVRCGSARTRRAILRRLVNTIGTITTRAARVPPLRPAAGRARRPRPRARPPARLLSARLGGPADHCRRRRPRRPARRLLPVGQRSPALRGRRLPPRAGRRLRVGVSRGLALRLLAENSVQLACYTQAAAAEDCLRPQLLVQVLLVQLKVLLLLVLLVVRVELVGLRARRLCLVGRVHCGRRCRRHGELVQLVDGAHLAGLAARARGGRGRGGRVAARGGAARAVLLEHGLKVVLAAGRLLLLLLLVSLRGRRCGPEVVLLAEVQVQVQVLLLLVDALLLLLLVLLVRVETVLGGQLAAQLVPQLVLVGQLLGLLVEGQLLVLVLLVRVSLSLGVLLQLRVLLVVGKVVLLELLVLLS